MTTKPLCPSHDSLVRGWRGQGCGEAGWGPGHRIPVGVTVAHVDESVAMIKGWCEEGRGCGDTPEPPRCQSRDKHEINHPQHTADVRCAVC